MGKDPKQRFHKDSSNRLRRSKQNIQTLEGNCWLVLTSQIVFNYFSKRKVLKLKRYSMRKANQFYLFIWIVITIIISIISTPVFADDISKYTSTLSELQQSIILNDKKRTSNAILKLKQLKAEIPLSLLLSEIKNAENKLLYRRILADFTSYKIRSVKKDNFINNISSLKEIIKDKNEQPMIRRYIISALTKGFMVNELKKERKNSTIDIIPLLTDIVDDKQENPKVVAKAIDSLSRIKADGINDKLLNMLDNWELEDPLKIKSASESLGRLKDERAIPLFINMINFTDDMDIFVTAVYSIGLTGSPEMIEPILNNFDRFNLLGRSACRGTLRRNKSLLIDIVAKEKTGPIIPSIVALGKIKEKSALPYLNSLLKDNILDENLILNTIEQIESQ